METILKSMKTKDLWFMYGTYQKEPSKLHNKNLKLIVKELKTRKK